VAIRIALRILNRYFTKIWDSLTLSDRI